MRRNCKRCNTLLTSLGSSVFVCPYGHGCNDSKVRRMIIMRGLPGSGKSYEAKAIAKGSHLDTVIFSTDDYFINDDGVYEFNPRFIASAHEWNQKRAIDAAFEGVPVIIIDNTNTQAWEMREYVNAALANGYDVELRMPQNEWSDNSYECHKRCRHELPREAIIAMAERFEYDVTIEDIINSKTPWKHV